MNKKTYRLMDLAVFTLIACAVEAVNVLAFNLMKVNIGKFQFNQVYTLSFAALLGMIAIYRWNAYGLAVAPLAGAASVLARTILKQNVTWNLWLSFTLGYLGLSVCLLFFYKREGGKIVPRDKERLRDDKVNLLLYYLSGYLSVEVLRAFCQIGSADYWLLLLNYIAFDLINILFGLGVLLIALKQDGLVVDMESYLLHLNDIKKKLAGQEFASKNININVEELAEADDINEAAVLDGGTLSSDDLKRMEENRRRFENRHSKYDDENEEFDRYRKSKEAKHGSR